MKVRVQFKTIIINMFLAFIATVVYISTFVYYLKMMHKAKLCENVYGIGGEIHCPEYLWNAIVYGAYYLFFIFVVFLVVKYFSKSLSSFVSMAFVPTLYIILVQVGLVEASFDLDNIGPDQIRANGWNEIYLFLSIYGLLFIGMILLVWNFFRRNSV